MFSSRPFAALALALTLGLLAPLGVAAAATPAPTSAAVPAAAAPAVSPEYKRGKLLFIQCRACHDVQADLPDKVGPNLAGLLGRTVVRRV